MWLDDLYPKAKFADALAMVEKAGHKKRLAAARGEWLNEARSAATANGDADVSLPPLGGDGERTPTRAIAPGDDDIYGSTPLARRPYTAAAVTQNGDIPDEDDLDALMAEAEAQDNGSAAQTNGAREDDLDDLDALMAESEAHPNASKPAAPAAADPSFDEDEEAMREMEGMW